MKPARAAISRATARRSRLLPTEELRSARMLDVYYWGTPNGLKIKLFLEEAGLPYRIIPVDIGKGEQFEPDFLRISPNNRIPAIVDNEPADGGPPLPVFESG